MELLLVEDEPKIGALISEGLRSAGYAVTVAMDAETALEIIALRVVDLFIIDIMLPRMDGLALCRRVRELAIAKPILVLTARDSTDDKVIGLEAGADDYLTKPFDFPELTARIKALLRKDRGYQRSPIVVGDLVIDPEQRVASRAGVDLQLSKKEFALLEFLAMYQGKIVTRPMIGQGVWGNEGLTYSNIIDVFINYIRKKVDGDRPIKLIHTIRGRGFSLGFAPPKD